MGQIWWTSHLVDVSCHFCMKHPIFGSSAVFSPRTFASCPANRNAHNWWSANTLMRACLAWELSWGEPSVHVEVQRAKAKAFWCCWMLPASKCAMPLTIRRRNRSRVSSSRFQRDWLTGFMVYLVGITNHSCFFLAVQNIWVYYNWYIYINMYIYNIDNGDWCIAGSSPWTNSSHAPKGPKGYWPVNVTTSHTEKHWQNYIKPVRNNTETQMFNNFIPSDQTVGLIPWDFIIFPLGIDDTNLRAAGHS